MTFYIYDKSKKKERIKKRRLEHLKQTEANRLENRKWADSSPKAERRPQLRRYMPDDFYNLVMRMKEPVYKFLIRNYQFDPNDPLSVNKYPIQVIGMVNMPLAIELSLWKFPVTLVVATEEEKKKVKSNMDVHGGNIDLCARDYYKGVKESRIIVYFDDDINIPRKHLIGYLKYLKTRCSMLIFAFRNDYDKEKIIDALKPVAVRDKYDEYIMVISY